MATVYRAQHPMFEHTVALKMLRPHLAAGPSFLARFR